MANTLKFGNGEWYGKKDTILAYNDENNNYKPLPFDFSRGSSATRVNKDGLIETVGVGEPRIDFKDNTKGALKLEPTRTNSILYSSDFSQWAIKSNVTISSNVGLAPDGTLSADRIVFNGTTNARVESGIQGINATSYTNDRPNSVWLKSESGTTTVQFGSSSAYLLTVTVTEEWQRFTYISKQGFPRIKSDNATSVLAWGYQFETNGDVSLSYATSYIPTSGSANGVTRVRDLSDTQNLSHVIGQTEGVIFYDAILVHKSTSTAEDLFELSIDDGSNQNIFFINNYNNTLVVSLTNGGFEQFTNNSYNPTEGERYKLAFAYKQNDFALYINGNQIATDFDGTVPTMNQITFGNYYNNQVNLSNSVKVNNLKFYNTRLSNSELQALTTI